MKRVSEYMRMRLAMKDLADFIKNDEEGFPDGTAGADGWDDAGEPGPGEVATGDVEMIAPAEPDPRIEEVERREENIAAAGRRRGMLDDVPVSLKRPKVAFMAAQRRSEKGKAKQLEKELPWHLIPEAEKPLYVEAERTQWAEHLAFEAVRPVSLTESQHVLDHEDPARILKS